MQLLNDKSPSVQIQIALTLGVLKDTLARSLLEKVAATTTVPLAQKVAKASLAAAPAEQITEEPTAPNPDLSPAEQALWTTGKTLYATICAACHQPHGLGQAGLAPPLAGSEWVAGSADRMIRIVLQGLHGPIQVKGEDFQLEMPSLAILDDQQIAGILTYVRSRWGSGAKPVNPGQVAAVRKATADHDLAWTAEELKAVPVAETSKP